MGQGSFYCVVRYIVIAIAVFVALFGSAIAQNTGMVRGTVREHGTGNVIDGATVWAISPAAMETTTTDRNGFFVFMFLPPGPITISASHAGYESFSVRDVCADSNITRSVTVNIYPPFRTIAAVSSTYPQWECPFGGE